MVPTSSKLPGVVIHTCDSSTQEDRVNDEKFKVIFKLHNEFEVSLVYAIPCVQKKKKLLTGNRMQILNADGERNKDKGEINH